MRLTRQVTDEIGRVAQESWPEECCGIVLAARDRPALGVRLLESDNTETRNSRRRYRLDHRVHIRAVEEELRSGARIVGYYHSHTGGRAVPSGVDAELACPGVTYLVAGPAQAPGDGERREPPELRAWRWTGDRFEEEAVSMEESAHGEDSDGRGA